MKVNLDDVAFWMDAVRNSENHFGVLESFWKGQLQSKIWLIENLQKATVSYSEHNVVIHGGWNGVLASLLYNSPMHIDKVRSIDIDPACEDTANMICKPYEMNGKFRAITCDMCEYKYEYEPDVVINTSTEHIDQTQYDTWLNNVPSGSMIVLQNNNYYDLSEHIRCFDTVEDFAANSGLTHVYKQATLELPLYNRFLLIGRK
jgi:hypothetical protein